MATRVLMVKADGSVLIHSDGGSYKPLNWMSPPCTLREGKTDDGEIEWTVTGAKSDDTLRILLEEVLHDSSHDLGIDPGLQKDGVEKHLQELLAEHPATLAEGLTLVRREFPTAIGPVDLMCRDAAGLSVAVEIKRRGDIDGVEQLTRYLELLNRDPLLNAKGPSAASSPPRRSSPRPASSPRTAASPAPPSTTTPCAASTTRATGCSECACHADLPHRHRRRLGRGPADRRLHDLHARRDPRAGGLPPRQPRGPVARGAGPLLHRRHRAAAAAGDRHRPARRPVGRGAAGPDGHRDVPAHLRPARARPPSSSATPLS